MSRLTATLRRFTRAALPLALPLLLTAPAAALRARGADHRADHRADHHADEGARRPRAPRQARGNPPSPHRWGAPENPIQIKFDFGIALP